MLHTKLYNIENRATSKLSANNHNIKNFDICKQKLDLGKIYI